MELLNHLLKYKTLCQIIKDFNDRDYTGVEYPHPLFTKFKIRMAKLSPEETEQYWKEFNELPQSGPLAQDLVDYWELDKSNEIKKK